MRHFFPFVFLKKLAAVTILKPLNWLTGVMKEINLDEFNCPHCGTSGADHLDANSQIEHTGRVDGEGWISCPDCGNYVEFTESGEVTEAKFTEAEWRAQFSLWAGNDQ